PAGTRGAFLLAALARGSRPRTGGLHVGDRGRSRAAASAHRALSSVDRRGPGARALSVLERLGRARQRELAPPRLLRGAARPGGGARRDPPYAGPMAGALVRGRRHGAGTAGGL